jgi:hypothetical protein
MTKIPGGNPNHAVRTLPRGIVLLTLCLVPLWAALSVTRAAAEPLAGAIPDAVQRSSQGALPVFRIIEGAKGAATAYSPAMLDIPADREVQLEITDNIGGCLLVTVFPRLGVNGGTVRARVPVGQTRRIVIRAPKPGRYRYHCSEDMYFGEIVAQ